MVAFMCVSSAALRSRTASIDAWKGPHIGSPCMLHLPSSITEAALRSIDSKGKANMKRMSVNSKIAGSGLSSKN